MSGKPKPMSQIKQLLRLQQKGEGIKTIARILGISKNTVKSYLNKVELLPLSLDELLSLDEPVLEAKFHVGNPAYTQDRFDRIKDKLDYFSSELNRVGVNKKLLWEEYRQQNPEGYGYSQFCYHLSQHLIARSPSMVLEHRAAEKLFVDFAGKKLSYVDRATGEVIYCQVFVACLPYSDYCFAMAVRSQQVADFIYALICCLNELGGTTKALVPDNMKSAITKANAYEPDVNRVLEDFANHYGMTVLPTRARKPKDKALVENQVKLIYSRVFARLRNQQFFDLASLNAAIREKVKEHNQTRMQQKPYSRQERFLADEKSLLSPLPQEHFEIKNYRTLKVAKNNHIYLSEDKHHYSVPYHHIGEKAKVMYTRSMVHIYVKGEQVALHVRNYQKGGYSTQSNHLCSHHRHYLDRSPEYYLARARDRSELLHRLFCQIFDQNRHPEQLYRTCDGLLNLHRKTKPEVFKKACELALQHENYSYQFVLNILKNKMTDHQHTATEQSLPNHTNIRGKDYYQSSLDL